MTPPPAPAPAAARRGRRSFARALALFLLVSLVAGVLVAGAALPFVGGAGVATRTAIENYEALPSQLTTPPLPQRSRILASDGSVHRDDLRAEPHRGAAVGGWRP